MEIRTLFAIHTIETPACAKVCLRFVFNSRRDNSELGCTSTTSWYYACNGPTPLKLATDKRVCSRIIDIETNKFITFESMQVSNLWEKKERWSNPFQSLFEYSAARKCDCCFLEQKPEDMTLNPFFNYYGPCLGLSHHFPHCLYSIYISDAGKEDVVDCEGKDVKAKKSQAGPACPIRAKPGQGPQSVKSFSTLTYFFL